MADNSPIEWTDATWNVITGCTVVSPGCTNCYAMKLAGTRLRNHPSRAGLTTDSKAGPVWNGNVRFNEDMLAQPMCWRRPRNIFVCAHGDLFHENVPDAWIDKVFAIMALAPQHTFQVLTKRADRMLDYVRDADTPGHIGIEQRKLAPRLSCYEDTGRDGPWPLPNVLLGVSVEDQTRADERRDHLGPLARKHGWRTFVSYEPALGPVDWIGWEFLSWMISGGESQSGSRPSHPDWHRTARDFCAAHGIPYLFKQWGDWFPRSQWEGNPDLVLPDDDYTMNSGHPSIRFTPEDDPLHNVGKTRAGRLLDGVEHNGMPEPRP